MTNKDETYKVLHKLEFTGKYWQADTGYYDFPDKALLPTYKAEVQMSSPPVEAGNRAIQSNHPSRLL